MLSRADRIWNRASHPDFRPARSGDQALHDVLIFHGQVMNGGLDYAIDGDGYAEAAAAAHGFRALNALALAETLEEARAIVARVADESGAIDILDLADDETEAILALGERYGQLLPDDSSLVQIFETYLAEHPDDFEPLSDHPGEVP